MRSITILLASLLVCLGLATSVDAGPREHHATKKPHTLRALPKVHHRIAHRGKMYFYGGGRFYRHNRGVYVSIAAPIGAIVPALPFGYVTFGIGPSRYFYFSGIYYQQVPDGYVVVDEPEEADTALARGSDRMIIYPAAGQTDEQRSKDKYECHEWAVSETLFDPTDPGSDPMLRTDYQRAMSACLEARKYVVK